MARLPTFTFAMVFLAAAVGARGAMVSDGATVESSSDQLAEIVVTAEKRESNIQSTPITMQAFTPGDLGSQRIQTSADLQLVVPTLVYDVEAGFALPYMRGVGTDNPLPNSDPDIATYVDGVYIANDEASVVSLLGVERVEVLQGPQGTLYGNNAIGGLISIVTVDPADHPEARISAGYGNYNTREGTLAVSGPLSDNLKGGIWMAGTWADSYYNVLIPTTARTYGGTPDGETSWGTRGKLVYESGALKLTGSYEHAHVSSMDAGITNNIAANALGVQLGAPFSTAHYYSTADGPSFVISDSDTVILHEELGFTGFKIVGITGYRDFNSKIAADFDGTAAPVVDLIAPSDFSTQYSQEIQFVSTTDSKLKWVAGLYGFFEKTGFAPTGVASSLLFAPVLGPGYWYSATYGTVKTQSYAAFGQATYALTDKFNLTLGARVGQDHKDFEPSFSDFLQVVNGSLAPPPIFVANYPERNATWNNFSPKITVDYKLGDTMFYATWARGYKQGVFNVASPVFGDPINPEKLASYEVGSKSSFFDNRMTLNLSAYYYDWSNIQVEVTLPQAGASSVLENGGGAYLHGAEASFDALLIPKLELKATAAWEKGHYGYFPQGLSSFDLTPTGNVAINIQPQGNTTEKTPEWVLTTRLQYTVDLPKGGSLHLNGDWYYNDGFFWEPSNQIRQPAFGVLGASVLYATPDDTWHVNGWIKNITNKYYQMDEKITGFGIVDNDAPPRMFGITLSKTFK
jgi:iron complex outermembrane receptor protein